MNHYGTKALLHWRAYLPTSYGRLEDPMRFFTDLGEQADAETEDRYLDYAGPDLPWESAEEKQERLTQAMNRAVEEVSAELMTRARPDRGSRTLRLSFAPARPSS